MLLQTKTPEHSLPLELHLPDEIDKQVAQEVAQQLQHEWAEGLLGGADIGSVIEELAAQYTNRSTQVIEYSGSAKPIVHEKIVFVTRTVDWRDVDELFEIAYDYVTDPEQKHTGRRASYRVTMCDGPRTQKIAVSETGEATFYDGGTVVDDNERQHEIAFDFYFRSLVAVETYRRRPPEVRESADADALGKTHRLGYKSFHTVAHE